MNVWVEIAPNLPWLQPYGRIDKTSRKGHARSFQSKAANSITLRRFDIREIAHLCCPVERDGGNTPHWLALVGMARDLAPADLDAVRTGIGAELRRLHSDLLREPIRDRMAERIKQLDQQTEASPRGQDADDT